MSLNLKTDTGKSFNSPPVQISALHTHTRCGSIRFRLSGPKEPRGLDISQLGHHIEAAPPVHLAHCVIWPDASEPSSLRKRWFELQLTVCSLPHTLWSGIWNGLLAERDSAHTAVCVRACLHICLDVALITPDICMK